MKQNRLKLMSEAELVKYDVARELGLTDRLLRVGWGGLTAEENGRIGGIIARRSKKTDG